MFDTGKLVFFSLVLIIVASIYWHYQGYIRQQSLEKSNAGLQLNIKTLQGQLHTAQKTLSETEAELQNLLAMDWQNKAVLQETQARDWEKKYHALELDQDDLLQAQVNMKHLYEMDMARMKRGLEFQTNQNNKLRNNLLEKEHRLDELAEELAKHESSISDLTRTITGLENKLQQQDKILKIKPVNIPAEPQKPLAQDTHSYRQVRMESLKTAMTGQDSQTRRIILADVIPTIPDGLRSDEFISLVSGMDSRDILNTLRKTGIYISRPFDNKFPEQLADMMDKNDAKEAILILTGQQ